jgi:hypothetical protein|tara:strand:- start:1427 stop:1732 length:306 start_codon:yes stop_codon:yes gene_type:complete
MIHITDDNFVWLDVTKDCHSWNRTQELFMGNALYEVTDEGRDSLIEEPEFVDKSIKRGNRICIEVGHLPKNKRPLNIWTDTKKRLINGYWYVKISDLINKK